jgi:predicted methyltransferase
MFHKVNSGDTVIDATAGNGNDTLFLANLVGEKGQVFAFDTQKEAILNTKTTLQTENKVTFVTLLNQCHGKMQDFVKEKVQLILFNLGYLPKSNKKITTKQETTMKAIKSSLSMLKQHGLTLIIIYRGHEEGKKEEKKIKQFVESLPQKQFNTFQIVFPNQANLPPIIIGIEKR